MQRVNAPHTALTMARLRDLRLRHMHRVRLSKTEQRELRRWTQHYPGGFSQRAVLSWPGWVSYLGPLPEPVEVGNSTQAYIPSPRLRQAVLARDGYRCCACGATERLTIDHIRPASEGGPTTLENLQTLCQPCNTRKGPAHGRGTRHEPPAAMAPAPHCPTCQCRVTITAEDEAAFRELMQQSAATDREIEAILAEGDRLALVGQESSHAK